jgi:signal recognition particle receptor subunit beta
VDKREGEREGERISVTREELYKMQAQEDLRKVGLLIFANKQDVKECTTVAEIPQLEADFYYSLPVAYPIMLCSYWRGIMPRT